MTPKELEKEIIRIYKILDEMGKTADTNTKITRELVKRDEWLRKQIKLLQATKRKSK